MIVTEPIILALLKLETNNYDQQHNTKYTNSMMKCRSEMNRATEAQI